jgi:hypothetical protein
MSKLNIGLSEEQRALSKGNLFRPMVSSRKLKLLQLLTLRDI